MFKISSPTTFILLHFFDITHGLAIKCKKPDDEAKTYEINFFNDLISLLTFNFALVLLLLHFLT